MSRNKPYKTNTYLYAIACFLLLDIGNMYAQSNSMQQSGVGYGFLGILALIIVLLFGQKLLKWIIEVIADIISTFNKPNKGGKDKWID